MTISTDWNSPSPTYDNSDTLSENFEPIKLESYWYKKWEQNNHLKTGKSKSTKTRLSEKDKQSYIVQFPPPNVTGTLHLGHAFNQTVMDSLVRYHCMCGKNTVFIPGTDHAGIATQIVVERQLESLNLSRRSLGRRLFIEKVWEWKEKSEGTIMKQVRRLGVSADWSREYFTMDKHMSRGVTETFVRLYKAGLIYRGKRLVNWDPKLQTAVSDLEVTSKEVESFLWYLLYPLLDSSGGTEGVLVATTRPETLLADTAICVHPDDTRYKHLIGKIVRVPLCNRNIPIIADSFVSQEFGTGCVKITGAHDFNDYSCSLRHNLPLISVFDFNLRVNENAPKQFQGLERDEARRIIVSTLRSEKYLVKTENYKTVVSIGERTGAVLEPMLTDQWFVAMNRPAPIGTLYPGKSITQIALDKVLNGDIQFYPASWKNLYNQWLNNIQDWCISRQLWWGHQIPAWYSEDGQVFVANSEIEALAQARVAGVKGNLYRDPDVLDTWFSSALIPFTTLGWPENTKELECYLPSNVLVTGFDIIFFWVARMIMLTTHLTGKIPFKQVYIHGLVRDLEGQKMSKSRGNTLDPVDLIEGISIDNLIAKRTQGLMNPKQSKKIEKDTRNQHPKGIPAFGADALRFTMMAYATPGRNLNFDLKRCAGYRNFCNKLWHATRYVLINTEGYCVTHGARMHLSFADKWITSRFQVLSYEIQRNFVDYRFDNISSAIYHFVWDEYCSWYLELAKVQLRTSTHSQKDCTRRTLIDVLEKILRLAHPLIPFITEELWQKVSVVAGKRSPGEQSSISSHSYPRIDQESVDYWAENQISILKNQVEAIRSLRTEMHLSPGQKALLYVQGNKLVLQLNKPYLTSLTNLTDIKIVEKLPNIGAPIKALGNTLFMLHLEVDSISERTRLDKEIIKLEEKISKVHRKLSNPYFIERAPEKVVAQEKERFTELNNTLNNIKSQRDKL